MTDRDRMGTNDPADSVRKRRFLNLHRGNPADDVADELAFHVEMRAALLMQRGVAESAAKQEALRRFGDFETVRAECESLERNKTRTRSRAMLLAELLQDIKWAVRSIKRAPAFASVVVLTLGVGIGANASIFSVVNAYLFRPLPVREESRLAVVAQTSKGSPLPGSVSYPNYLDVQSLKTVFSDAVLFQVNVASARAPGSNDAERVFLNLVSDNYFSALGLKPAAGSLISIAGARRKEALIVLDYRYWSRRFNRDPSIVGQSIRLNGTPYTVAGVIDKSFMGTEQLVTIDAYIPISTIAQFNSEEAPMLENRSWSSSRVLAWLKPEVGTARAQLALTSLARELARKYPDESTDLGFAVAPEKLARPDLAVSKMVPWIAGVFLGLTTLVLLVACVNVTNLMLARSNSRQSELAVRRALGAGNARLVRQLLTESVVLSVMGLMLGLILARWVTGYVSNFHLAVDFPVRFNVSLDWRVFAATATIAVLAGIITGIAPALRSGRGSLADTLREGSRGGTGNVLRQRLQGTLVVAQIAVSLVLIISAGLFARSVRAAANTDLGFRIDHQLLMSTDIALLHLNAGQKRVLFAQLQERATTLPGVQSAALARDLPMGGNNNSLDAYFDENIPGTNSNTIDIYYNTITPRYFETIGMKLLAGREFTADDRDSTTRVVIINAEMAKQFWPNRDAVGQQFRFRKDGPKVLIVGVATNSKYMFLNEPPRPYLYVPFAQRPTDQMTLHLRTTADPATLARAAREVVRGLNPELALFGVKTMETHLNFGLAFLFVRFGALVATTLGLLGLLQSIVGLYGVVSYGVSQRTREFGIRLALGASSSVVARDVLKQGAVLTAIGLTVGLAIAAASTRLMNSLLFGVSATDWETFAVAAVLLGVVATLSAYVPARRASKLDPLVALRAD
ncbi:MAG: ABC transporter permease [Gemmatimonas sp.]